MRKQQGFTLAEMMVAISIMGIVTAIAVPNYRRLQQRTRISQAHQGLKALFVGEAGLWSGGVTGQGINGSAQTSGGKTFCRASCYGPSRNGNWMDIPSGGEAVPWDFYTGWQPHVGEHCKAINFNLDAATYFWFSSTYQPGSSTTCSGGGNWISVLTCANNTPPPEGACLYKNEARYDFDGDGYTTRIRQFVRNNARNELYRDGSGIVDGDMDDAYF